MGFTCWEFLDILREASNVSYTLLVCAILGKGGKKSTDEATILTKQEGSSHLEGWLLDSDFLNWEGSLRLLIDADLFSTGYLGSNELAGKNGQNCSLLSIGSICGAHHCNASRTDCRSQESQLGCRIGGFDFEFIVKSSIGDQIGGTFLDDQRVSNERSVRADEYGWSEGNAIPRESTDGRADLLPRRVFRCGKLSAYGGQYSKLSRQ